MRKLLAILLLLLLLFSNNVYSATQTISVVENPQPKQEEVTIWGTIKSMWLPILLLIIIAVVVIWFIIWLIKKIRDRRDLWIRIMKDKKELCRIHRDSWRIKKYFRYSQNCPIKLIYRNDNSIHTKTIGHYRGHYISRDGNMTIMFNFRRRWLVFPKPDIIMINMKSIMTLTKKVVKEVGNRKELVMETEEIELPHNIITFNPDEVIINAYSLDMDYRTEILLPVLKDINGNILNLGLPTFIGMKQIALEGYLYDQTDDYAKTLKKSLDINPLIKGFNKVSDNSSSIETEIAQKR